MNWTEAVESEWQTIRDDCAAAQRRLRSGELSKEEAGEVAAGLFQRLDTVKAVIESPAGEIPDKWR